MKKQIVLLLLGASLTLSPTYADSEGKEVNREEKKMEIALNDEDIDSKEEDINEDIDSEEENVDNIDEDVDSGEEESLDENINKEKEDSDKEEYLFDNNAEGKIEIKGHKKKDDKKEDKDEIKTYVYHLNGNRYEFLMYKADMKDKANYIDVKMAEDKIGHLNYLHRLVNESKSEDENSEVLAAINGGLFNMGYGRQPITSVIEDGNLKYIYYKGAMANFDGENEMSITRDDYEVFFAVNNCWEEPYGFKADFINQVNYQPNGVGLLTSDYDGEQFNKEMTAVEVKDKTVVYIHKTIPRAIPNGNLLIVSEANEAVKKIKVGDRVDYVFRRFDRGNSNNKLQLPSIRTGIGSGPAIIQNHQIAIDTQKDNLMDLGIYNSRPRSMVGMTEDRELFFVVAKSIDINTFAKLGLKLGLKNALNLDGGGSSGLMIGDRYAYRQWPERAIANALIIKRHKEVPIRIVINDQERFYDTNPYIYEGRTMLPLRGILENLECKVSWDDNTKEVVFERYGKKYAVKMDSYTIRGEDKDYEMDVPLLVRDGRSAISARYLSEILGGEVDWNEDKRLVDIKIASANEKYRLGKDAYLNGNYEDAKKFFEEALKADEKNISSLNGLANIDEQDRKFDAASEKYLKILEINDNYIPSFLGLGKIYEDDNKNEEAIDMYMKLIDLEPKHFHGLNRLGHLYEKTEDNINAIKYYELAYDIDKQSEIGFNLVKLYKKELKGNDKDFDLLKKIASTYDGLNVKKYAIEYFEKAYKIKKTDIALVRTLASLYEDRDYEKAIEYYEAAYKLDKTDLETVKKLAAFYYKKNKNDLAIKYYQAAFDLNRSDLEIIKTLASLYYDEEKMDLAAEYYEKAFAIDANSIEFAKKLAIIYDDEGKVDLAIKYYKKTYELSKDEAILLTFLELCHKANKTEEAIYFFESLGNIYFAKREIYYNMAEFYLEENDNPENEKAYKMYKLYLNEDDLAETLKDKYVRKAEDYIEEYDEREQERKEKEEKEKREREEREKEENSDNDDFDDESEDESEDDNDTDLEDL